MSVYARRVFPWLIDSIMSAGQFRSIRQELLAEVRGHTLEIGFGTGLNLEHYPATLTRLTAIDNNPGMRARAGARARSFDRPVELLTLDGESLPFADATFDSAVSTWTLCSIADVARALDEIYRVLKPTGRFFFAEHGLSDEFRIRKWQRRLTPIQKKLGDGCHLDRDMRSVLEGAGFAIDGLETFYMDKAPRIGGFIYKGVGEPSGRRV